MKQFDEPKHKVPYVPNRDKPAAARTATIKTGARMRPVTSPTVGQLTGARMRPVTSPTAGQMTVSRKRRAY